MFPVITNLNDVLPAIAGRDEFVICEKEGYKIINYLVNFIDTFLDPLESGISKEESLIRQIRRECRGITFCSETGKLIRRPLHKFFNVGEKPECQSDLIDISKPHFVLEKLDGSMICPLKVSNRLIWGTKMGETEFSTLVEDFVKSNQNILEMADELLSKEVSPIFEFTSLKNRVVIAYNSDNLTLLAARHMFSGNYLSRQELEAITSKYKTKLVKYYDSKFGINDLINHTKDLVNQEGFVISFENGQKFKIKADDYLRKHKCKDEIQFEKNILDIIFNEKLDDVLADLSKEDAEKVKKYSDSVLHSVMEKIVFVQHIVKDCKQKNLSKKQVALEVVPNFKEYASLIFSGYDDKDIFTCVKKLVLSNLGSQSRVDSIRFLIGDLKWNDIYHSYQE